MTSISTANAQPSDRFPESVQVEVSGERHQAFNLPGFVELLRIDADLVHYHRLYRELLISRAALTGALEQQESIIQSRTTQVTILRDETTRLHTMWLEENKKRHAAENRRRFGSVFGWMTALVLGVLSATLIVVMATR